MRRIAVPMVAGWRSGWMRGLLAVCLVSFLSFGGGLHPISAQTSVSPATVSKADVVMDGRVLFRLGSIQGFTATGRANLANQALQQALQTTPIDQPILIQVVERDDLMTLRVNDHHLLTLTQSDSMPGVTTREQAEAWAAVLTKALQQAQWERQPRYFYRVLWNALLAILAAIALYSLVHWQRRRLWRRWTQQWGRLPYRQRLTHLALLGVQVGLGLSLAFYLCELFPQARSTRYQVLQFLTQSFNHALLRIGGESYSLVDLFTLLLLVVSLWIGVQALTSIVKLQFLQPAIHDRGAQDAIAILIQFGLTGLGVFILLQAWGIDLSTLAIFASVLGVGVGFGLQNIVNNFISGWVLFLERPIQIGDLINVGDLIGTVERIGARSTEIRTLDQISIIVPNAELVQSRVINWSHGHPVSRIHLPFGVAYGSAIAQVHQAAIEAAQSHPDVLRYPQPHVRFLGFGESSLDLALLIWIRDPRHQFDIQSDVYFLLEANLRRYQIEIPFPQRDLHLRTPELYSMLEQQYSSLADALPQPEPPLGLESTASEKTSLLSYVTPFSAILKSRNRITPAEMKHLAAQMRGEGGLAILDRRFRLKVYPKCFIGTEAVTWIANTQNATREAAVNLGQALLEEGIFHHVSDEHPFKDEYLFYRFYEDEGEFNSIESR